MASKIKGEYIDFSSFPFRVMIEKRKESNTKKETAIFIIVISLFVGFAIGATVGILYMVSRGEKEIKKTAVVQKPQMTPSGAPASASPARDSMEFASQIQTLKEIVKKDPRNLSAWVELGNLYFDSDQPQEAIEAYRQYLAIKPDNPDVRTDMGIMYKKLGQFDKALEEFRKSAQSDPKHANSRYNIGVVLLHDKQDIGGAIKAWEEYLRVDPNSERAQRIRAQIDKMKAMSIPSK
jgi:cytochrome c-type biogenesis protein CcmH/NrfG